MKKIIISGWYGFGNVGDEAILQSMIDIFNKQYPNCEITVFSFIPEYNRRYHGIKAIKQMPWMYGYKGLLKSILTLSILKYVKLIKECDLFVIGGGGFLSDWQPEAPRIWLSQAKFAKFFDKQTILYRIGAGPFVTEQGSKIVKTYIDKYVDKVIVRDRISFDNLVAIGICADKIRIMIDPVAEMNVEKYKSDINNKEIGLVYDTFTYGEQLKKWEDLKRCYVAQIETVIKNNFKPIVMMFQITDGEKKLAEFLLNRFGNEIDVRFYEDFKLALIDIGKVSGIISLRFHGNVISYSFNKPFLPIIYHHKAKGFLELINYKPQNLILEVGDGVNWQDKDLDIDEWIKITQCFLILILKWDIKLFYDKEDGISENES